MAENTPQTLATHVKMDPPFHYFLLPFTLFNVIYSGYRVYRDPGLDSGWLLLTAAVWVVAVFLIRVYPLKVQDRVIRLEERLRMQALLPADLNARAQQLTEKQLVALRFASDRELPELVRAVLDQNLAQAEIKKRIESWRGDYYRV